jgi:hypothetical protein
VINTATPSVTKLDPNLIKFQIEVIRDVRLNFDYTQGTHEILLSGALGCLKEDALIETIGGRIPISDIKPQDFVLSFHHLKDQFVFQSCSGAYPKGRDYLYRVIHEQGEFVAAENHLCATSQGVYLPVSQLSSHDALLSYYQFHDEKCHVQSRSWYLSYALRYWETLVSLICHCVERIRLCGQPLRLDLDNVLNAFPLRADVQEYGQFYASHKTFEMDGLRAMELTPDHLIELSGHKSMHDFVLLLEGPSLGVVNQDIYTKSYEHIFLDTLQSALFELNSVNHPKVLLSFLCRIYKSFEIALSRYKNRMSVTKSAILKIEKQYKKEWYWDLKVPNTNNYLSNGSVHHNSSKTTLLGHLVVTHCMFNPGARVLIGRRTLPDLRATLFAKIVEHIGVDLEVGKDYFINQTTASIKFRNGSEIISRSWADTHFMKVRSLDLSMAAIEELSENDDSSFYQEIKMRVGRLNHVRENIIICATNPDSPASVWFDYFEMGKSEADRSLTKHVYYSKTRDNPFLAPQYIEQLQRDLDPRMARRMLEGEWLEIAKDVVYYAYVMERNHRDYEYKYDEKEPIHFSWDFNIGTGKPLSVVIFQFIKGVIHLADEVIVHGLRTEDSCEELAGRGFFEFKTLFYVHGDASGRNRDTRNIKSDYDIIKNYLANYRTYDERPIDFVMDVPLANPPIRKRHNVVNSHCLNDLNETRLFTYKGAKMVSKGLRLVALREGSNYVEDDSKEYQHVTTALGYGLVAVTKDRGKPQGTVQL